MEQLDLFTYDLPPSDSDKTIEQKEDFRKWMIEYNKRSITDAWKEIAHKLWEHGIVPWECALQSYGRVTKELECGTYDYDLTASRNKNGMYTLEYWSVTGSYTGSWIQEFSNQDDLIKEIVRIRGDEKDC